ncbi:histidine kinase [Cytophagales bacterium WSM2-2]|nr:histidine kinase [Cytophagales bacterium WSM2-2]
MTLFDNFVYSKRWDIRILRHMTFWIADSLSYLFVISANTQIKPWNIESLLFNVPVAALITYFIIYYLLPSYSRDHNKLKLVAGAIAVFLYIGVGMRYYRFFIVYAIVDPAHPIPPNLWSFAGIAGEVFSWMTIMSLAVAIKMTKNKAELQRKNEMLLEEKKIAELSFLKAQMHPHFLFNTLNTLYSEIIRGGDKSEQIVLRLSNLLRFMLEECNQRVIPIEKEIRVIEDYIQLEKLRHGTRLRIDYESNLNGSSAFVSPLLLLPFVENSCKHTLSTIRGEIHIKVRIKAENNSVNLFVENELSTARNGSSRGIGINNIKRQLELLYDKDYKLDILQNNGMFAVHLEIPTLKKDE